MIHAAVLNIQESLFKFESTQGSVSALDVFSPAQVLPLANYSTVLDRWRRWSIMNGVGPGAGVDPDGELGSDISRLACWVNLVMVRDCLSLNDCLVAKTETACQVMRASLEAQN
eukprot:8846103-Pyramimonas_sp.AAC.1